MTDERLELYWSELPIGKSNAISYAELMIHWGRNERECRQILHDLSRFDNGDDYILIRSSKNGGGFYRTDNADEIKAYRQECLNKGRSIFAPVKKINRVLNANDVQINLENNLRVFRELHGLKQWEVCDRMKQIDEHFDVSLLSRMENGICLPTPFQLVKLAEIYTCKPSELISSDFYM